MKRQCECKGREHPQLCLVHRAMDYIKQTKPKPGDELFPEISGWSDLCLLRRILKMLSVGTADAFTWKCIRAGKATAMADANMPLQEICAAGEWRDQRTPSRHYANEDMADEKTMITSPMEELADESQLRQMVMSDDEG